MVLIINRTTVRIDEHIKKQMKLNRFGVSNLTAKKRIRH